MSFVVCGQATQVVPPAGGVSVRQGGPGDGQAGGHRPAGAQLQRRSAARVKTHSHTDILPPEGGEGGGQGTGRGTEDIGGL